MRNIFINITQEELENEYSAFEGKQKAITHLKRERNSHIVKLAKDNFKNKHDGKVFCEILNCNFDFSKIYGERGSDFIEAHHIKPISERDESEETTIDDFLMVCSNCHRMIHRKPYLADNELNELIKNVSDN